MQKISAVNGSVSFTYDTRLWYFLQPEHVGKIRQDCCILRYFVNEKMLYDTVAAAEIMTEKGVDLLLFAGGDGLNPQEYNGR